MQTIPLLKIVLQWDFPGGPVLSAKTVLPVKGDFLNFFLFFYFFNFFYLFIFFFKMELLRESPLWGCHEANVL